MFSDKQLKDMILPLLMEYPDLSDNTTAHKKFFLRFPGRQDR